MAPSKLGMPVIDLQCLDLFLDVLGLFNALSNLGLVTHGGPRRECPVQSRPEVGEAEGVFSAEVEEFFVDGQDLAAELGVWGYHG
jgi:hypothetical protein